MSVCASVVCFYIGTCAQWGSEHAVSAAFSHFLCPPRGLSVSHVFYETSLDPWCLQGNKQQMYSTKQPQNDYETRSHVPNPVSCSISAVDKLPLAEGPCDWSLQ